MFRSFLTVGLLSIVLMGCSYAQNPKSDSGKEIYRISDYIEGKGYEKYEVATLAGGCFWCTEAAFERIKGVVDVISGHSGGDLEYPTYRKVSTGTTKHTETVQIYYDPEVVTFDQLLEVFVVAHDPTQLNRQGNDIGPQYRSEVFYHNDEQKEKAKAFFKELDKSGKFGKKTVTKITPYKEFWTAEAYHQDYYEQDPNKVDFWYNTGYIMNVTRPKVEKVKKTFQAWLKDEYRGK
ncbi:MAG: peptide-methionine (S)-S-oxide reductase MsrA [Bacteroidota bacterium]